MTFPPVAEQLAVIRRGVEKIVPEEELAKKLEWSRATGKPLRVKYGIDPTGIDVHLGHTVPLRKMRQFQELGHQVVIIIGNATAMVGDPSGRDEARKKRLTAEDVERNAKDYFEQVGRVVDLSKAEVHRNGDWFGSMNFGEIIQLCSHWTIQQILHREDFARRIASENPVFLHECLYPIMQAFDSVCIGADVELGGTEQLFTFILARHLQTSQSACELAKRWMNDQVKSRLLPDGTLPAQIGVMSPILVGLDGVRRMGKSLGNYIGISEPPYEMMKKFMQLPDAVMKMYFELLTDIPLPEIETILAGHPKEAKLRLGTEVISQYHRQEPKVHERHVTETIGFSDAAIAAVDRWQREVGGGALPRDIPEYRIPRNFHLLRDDEAMQIGDMLVDSKICASYSQAVQKLREGAVFVYEGDSKRKLAKRDDLIHIFNGLVFGMGKKELRRVVFDDDVKEG